MPLLIGDEFVGPRRCACLETVSLSRSHTGNTQTEVSKEAEKWAMMEEKVEVGGYIMHRWEPPFVLLPQAPQQVGLGLYFADVPEHFPYLLHSLAPVLDLCSIKQTVICF